jgi:hypothetical protein
MFGWQWKPRRKDPKLSDLTFQPIFQKKFPLSEQAVPLLQLWEILSRKLSGPRCQWAWLQSFNPLPCWMLYVTFQPGLVSGTY